MNILLHIFFGLAVRAALTVSSSSKVSVSPVVLLKLLVLDEEREMFGLLLLHSFSLMNGLLRETEMFYNRQANSSLFVFRLFPLQI